MAYSFFDHTADIGIQAEGRTLAELFADMARGLVELIAEQSPLEAREAREVSLEAEGTDALLLAWLQEVLLWHEMERFLPTQYAFSAATETLLRGEVRGERFDPARHTPGREVKAVTRHLLKVERHGAGWHGQVVVDI